MASNHKVWLVRAAVALGVIVLVLGILLATHWPFSRADIAEDLQESLPGTVQFATFRSTYFPHPGCVAEGMTLTHPGAPSNSPPLATVARLTIQAGYLDLFLRPGYVARIRLEGLRVLVPRKGTYANTDSPPPSISAAASRIRVGQITADNSLLEIARSGDSPPLRFDIHRLSMYSVSHSAPIRYTVALHNPEPPGEITSTGQFGPWNSQQPRDTPLSGEYTFAQADLGSFEGIAGILSATGTISGNLGKIETQGSVDVPDFRATRTNHRVHLASQFSASVNGMNGDVFLDNVKSSLQRTSISSTGSVAHKPPRPGKTASLDCAIRGGRIEDLLYLVVRAPRAPLRGEANLRANVIIPTGDQPFLQKLEMVGDFGVSQGKFTKPGTQEKVTQLSERAQGQKNTADDNDPNLISDLAGHAEVRNGVATLTDLSFSVPGAYARMHGTYNLINERIDLHGTLKSDAEFTKVAGGGVKSVLLKPFDLIFKRKRAGAVIPVKITGTYSDPQPGLDILPK